MPAHKGDTPERIKAAARANPMVRGIWALTRLAEGEKDRLFEQGRTDEVWDKEATF